MINRPWKWVFLLIGSLLLFAGSWYSFHLAQQDKNLDRLANRFGKALDQAYQEVGETLADIHLTGDSLFKQLPAPDPPYRTRYLIYHVDTLKAWNTNRTSVNGVWEVQGRGGTVITLPNGDYLVAEHERGDWRAFALVPIQLKFPIDNKYLPNWWAFPTTLPKGTDFSATAVEDSTKTAEVRSANGDISYGYILSANHAAPATPVFGVISFALAWILLLILLWLIAAWLARNQSVWLGLGFLTVCLLLLRWYLLFPGYPSWLSYLGLFGPTHFAQSVWVPSLGDLLLHVLVGFLLVLFFNTFSRKWSPPNRKTFFVCSFIGVVLILAVGYVVLETIESLVLDSNISFNLNNFFSLDSFTFAGLLVPGALLLGWFILSYRLIKIWFVHRALSNRPWLPIEVGVLVFVLALISVTRLHDLLTVLVIGLGLILGLFLTQYYRLKIRTFWYQVGWMALFAILLAALLYRFNNYKELQVRKLYVNVLLQEDHLTEFLFDQAKDDIQRDAFVRGYFQNPLLSKRQLNERLSVLYLKGYLAKYDIQVHSFLKNNIPYKNADPLPLSQFFMRIDSSGRTTPVQDLYFFPESPDGLEYMAMLRVYKNPQRPNFNEMLGRLVIEFKTKSIATATLYPELLLSESVKPSEVFADYEYAIYSKGKLVRKEGYSSYPLTYTNTAADTFHVKVADGMSHLIYEGEQGNAVWVSAPAGNGFFDVLSLFSSVFILFFAVLLLGQGAYGLWRWIRGDWTWKGLRHISFRTRIQYAIVAVILISFITIGTITIQNTNRQYEDYHREILQRKARQILAGLEYQRTNVSGLENSWQPLIESDQLNLIITSLSEIHSMDINVFGTEGQLIQASQPAIFEKGLVAPWVDPVAYRALITGRESQVIRRERIGRLLYLSAYIPLINRDNKVQAILNLPYYAQEKNQDEEINNFLTYFINIYVLLFLLAGGIGILISNSVTRPLSTIGGMMRAVQLGRRNEPIRWRGKDEIGQMIDEYNKMIHQLEESAKQLAQSERESAWREMAKQVAHEIKNPLTPMKLSIQLLQRAAKDQSDDMNERVDRVSKTLIEQIEQLSHIASEFSSFAKMPPAQIEPMIINDLVRSVADLFKNEAARFEVHIPDTAYEVLGDKGQLVRVFNNLITNAIQAIPDDRQGQIFIGMRREGDEVIVKVEDNGVGIPEDQRDKVFTPNFTTKSSGTGLGLAMSKNMVELAGGRIWFESEVGKGTTFYVALPLND